MEFGNYLIGGVPLTVVVFGLVEWIKKLGVKGVWVNVVSMTIGALTGIAYQFSVSPPVDFSGWFTAIVFGLGLGIMASGVYDGLTNATKQTM